MMHPQDLLQSLGWRYATKRFDPDRKIPAPTWEALEAALVLAPSSFGLQPWRFLVIQDPDLRARLRPACWNQPQITEASHLVVFLARQTLGTAEIDHFLARIAEVRDLSLESMASYRDMMVGSLVTGGLRDRIPAWTTDQVYIALGTYLTAAAVLGIDACPMEGFDAAAVDQILGLEGTPWHAVVMAPAGYRDAGDKYAALAKVRFPAHEVIAHL
jgi:nitroreductase